jgi:YidC/Oxa1 family membrane protein insertase
MRTELRFLLAIVLMVGVLVGTNILFPPVIPDTPTEAPGVAEREGVPEAGTPSLRLPPGGVVDEPSDDPAAPVVTAAPERLVTVETPLVRYTFTTRGGRVRSAILPNFESFAREGPVELVGAESGPVLGSRVVVGADTVDLGALPFEVEPANGLLLSAGGGPQTLVFRHTAADPRGNVELRYTFLPDAYVVQVEGRVGFGGTVLLTELGDGLPLNEAREQEELRSRAYVTHHPREGVEARELTRVDEVEVTEGPLYWAGFRSRYFVLAMLANRAEGGVEPYLGGALATPIGAEESGQVELVVAQPMASGGFSYRFFAGPQDYARLSTLGHEFQEINAYGWDFLRPILRPIVGVVTALLLWLHTSLGIGYGWVLVLFGVGMRILLWPLNQRAMRAQFRNMAVQPLLQDAQKRYKDDPEKLQKELMKLYKEHGFNPLAGCLPLLLPWPILITLFFVFQNTIELRGVPFLWLPDLSAPDPYFILPIFLGLSMFLLQWVSFRSMDQINPQMKFMLWFMPLFMVFIFFQFASGLNLYYAVSNVATIPQQWWIAKERKKVKVQQPEPATG